MYNLYVVIDMQNDFVTGPLGSQEAQAVVPKIKEVLDKMDETDMVVFTMDTHQKDYLATFEGQKLPIPHCIEYTEGWEVVKELDEYNKLAPFRKTTFGSEDLASFIESRNFMRIVFMGVCTDICVVSNALIARAVRPDLPIAVIKDCCAGTTPIAHAAALNVMNSCQIDVI